MFLHNSKMSALFRDATAGTILRKIAGGRILPYDDEKPGFKIPDDASEKRDEKISQPSNDPESDAVDESSGSSTPKPPQTHATGQVVDWYGPDDPDKPQNWSTAKKTFVFFQICFLTFAGEPLSSCNFPKRRATKD